MFVAPGVYFPRTELGVVMGCNFVGFIVSPVSEGIFITDICGQMVVNAEVKLSFV